MSAVLAGFQYVDLVSTATGDGTLRATNCWPCRAAWHNHRPAQAFRRPPMAGGATVDLIGSSSKFSEIHGQLARAGSAGDRQRAEPGSHARPAAGCSGQRAICQAVSTCRIQLGQQRCQSAEWRKSANGWQPARQRQPARAQAVAKASQCISKERAGIGRNRLFLLSTCPLTRAAGCALETRAGASRDRAASPRWPHRAERSGRGRRPTVAPRLSRCCASLRAPMMTFATDGRWRTS